jgi:hypothetical protein
LEHWHEKHFNAMYHRDFGPESIRPKTRSKKATTYIYQTNSWEEQAHGEQILARAIVRYCLFVLLKEGVVNQIPSFVDLIKSEPACYFSKAYMKKWSVIHLTAWGWYLQLNVVPSVEDSLYVEHAQLMDREKAKMQDAMDAKHLAVPLWARWFGWNLQSRTP